MSGPTTGPPDARLPSKGGRRAKASGPALGPTDTPLDHHPHVPRLRFLDELKHRNVWRIAILYLLVCWLILEPVHVVFHMLDVPAWANQLIVILMVVGLPVVMLFAWVYEITPEGVKYSSEIDPQKSIRKMTGRRLDRAITVVLVIGIGYLLADKFWISKHTATEPRAAVAMPAAPIAVASPTIPEKSVAVLPFLDLSEKKDQEYFSEGLSEELIDMLTKVPDLRVPARTSSFYFKDKPATIPEIAKALSVSHVLEGSVRKSGNALRITAQLIRANDGFHLWSETYDRPAGDIFATQDSIAMAVVEALKATLLPSQSLANSHQSSNSDAYDHYLLGKRAYNVEDYPKAVATYRRAVTLDPQFAAAWAGLAEAEADLQDTGTGERAGLQRAVDAAERAVSLGPEQPEGYVVRAFLRYEYFWNWGPARADLDKATVLDSRSSSTHIRFSELLAAMGHLPEAIAEAQRALEADPLSGLAWRKLGMWLLNGRQYPAAEQALSRAHELMPDSALPVLFQSELAVLEGQNQLAEERSQLLEGKGHDVVLITKVLAGHSAGDDAQSVVALKELIEKYSQTDAYQIAQVYAWRGEGDDAFKWLDRSVAQHDSGLQWTKTDPFLDKIRPDPRYRELLKKLNLSD